MSAVDPELAAVQAIARALEPLDSAACRRVLTWASERYVESRMFAMDDFDNEAFTKFVKSLNEAARTLGTIAPLDILKFVEYVDKLKQQNSALTGLAAEDDAS